MNYLLLTLSLFFGVMPFNRYNLKFDMFLSYIQMIVVPIFYLVCYALVNFGKFGIYQRPSCDSICRLGNQLFTHMGCCLYLSIHVLNLWRRKSFFVEFRDSINQIDEDLAECDKLGAVPKTQATDSTKKRAKIPYVFYLTWLVVVIAFGFAMIYDVMEMVYYYYEFFFISYMVSSFPYAASSVVLGQFIYYVAEISKRFEKLNELLQRINRESDRKHGPIMVFDFDAKVEKGSIAGSDGNQELRLRHGIIDTLSQAEDSDDFNEDLDELKDSETIAADGTTSETNLPELFKLHDKILSLCVLTNSQYGLQCVPYMAVCFVIAIFGIFLQTKVYFIVGGKNRILDYVVFIYLIWSLTAMLVAFLVLRLCCNANGYSKESAMIVHEIMQKKPAFMLGNDIYYNKMKAFTLQFLHWEGYFQFNGIGLFTLDYTFIFSAVSAATSYLIVLLQFDMTSILKSEGLL